MKKIYIAPLTKVVNVKVEQMLTGSQQVNLKSITITGEEGGFEKADKEDYDDFGELW